MEPFGKTGDGAQAEGHDAMSRKRGIDAAFDQVGTPSTAADWLPILERLSISAEEAARIEARAVLAGVPFQAELLASGLVSERGLFHELADSLGLAFLDQPDPDELVMQDWQRLAALASRGGAGIALSLRGGGQSLVLIAPEKLDIQGLRNFIARYPRASTRIRVVPPSALRRAIAARSTRSLMRIATGALFAALPDQSARFVVNAWQGAIFGALSVSLLFAALLVPGGTLLAVHGVLSLVFLACVVLRVSVGLAPSKPHTPKLSTIRPGEMPVYTVLVALYKEAEVVPDLLVALGRIVWPRAKLEIKLVCEGDDTETLNAIRAQELRSYIEIIEVPPGGPRTKPKALSYALPMTSGDFVVLYDAEDRPHPFQLVEAWQRFRESDRNLACLQAPLNISNKGESWISAMFALEYSALFRGILPWFARHGLVLPLGGTSNHFRRSALMAVHGWDPYNVTEDADLGVRLRRQGYRTDVIHSPTLEDAPTDLRTWLPQRTRWFKGWAQTWLVHMRDPAATHRELGLTSFVVMQVMFAGMVLSALAYSVFLTTAAGLLLCLAIYGDLQSSHLGLLVLDGVNIVCGHLSFLMLGWSTLGKTERPEFWKRIVCTPVYWVLISIAAWRCLWQLYWRPHHWEKTMHRPSQRAARQPRKDPPEPMILGSSAPIASRSRPS